ncbi:PD-(D/E)XK nuclease family protein [Tenacibaculum piscium]|uniref:PD-(D/E)XK nuclease family protein n=1 Tax=Tenacibaculum piscium TaxID=1458515 RepID=UPI00187B7996|nr:PD-(D/E)XK nuclease family protein [Tenacibaculum piscium]MBE7691232.1 hypothetical protein [Tenacibaculum piscium]
MNSLIYSYNLIEEFNDLQKIKKSKIPYQINLLDEIGTNENAHSRFFLKFLSYKSNGEFLFLRKFLDSLGGEFKKIKIDNPIFTAEKERIDVLISDKDGNYSIIIENKINNAPDQPNQIVRYINIQKNNGFHIDNIYVLYLTDNGSKKPSEKSFPKEKREILNERYSEINFKNEILKWLKSLIISCKEEEVLLKSALLQYIDYLEGRFNRRKIETGMNNELKIFLNNKINLTENDYTNIKVINSEIQKLNNLSNHFQDLQNDAFQKIILDWKTKMSNNQNYKIVTNIENDKIPKYMYLGYLIEIKNTEVVCGIGLDSISDIPYFGLTTRGCENEKKIEIIKRSKKIEGFTSSPRWYLLRKNNLDNIFEAFNEFMSEIIIKNKETYT